MSKMYRGLSSSANYPPAAAAFGPILVRRSPPSGAVALQTSKTLGMSASSSSPTVTFATG